MTIFGLSLPSYGWAVIVGIVGIFVLMTWWAIRDTFARDFDSSNEKMFWVQICTVVPFIGVLAYIFIGRKRGRKTT